MNALIDDQLLSEVLRDRAPAELTNSAIFTTGYWYVRLCRAVLGCGAVQGALSGPVVALPEHLRARVIRALMELPEEIGLISLRTLAPLIGELRQRHELNILAMEALAAARYLRATVYLSARMPRLEASLEREGMRFQLL